MDVKKFTTGTTEAHKIVIKEDFGLLMKVLDKDSKLVHAQDSNGWTPLHEAVRGDSEAIVELLVERGADVNAPTKFGETPLMLVKKFKGDNHPFVDLLKSLGAKMGPEL